MPKVWSTINLRRSQAGFSLVEVLLAATIFGFLVIAVSGAIIYGRSSAASAGERLRATQLADEGMEVVRTLRDNSYTNLTDGQHGLAHTSSAWSFSGTSDLTGIFTRKTTIATIDATRKSVTVTVTWQIGQSSYQVTDVSQLTNWAALFNGWPGSYLAGSYDAPGPNDGVKVTSKSHFVYLVRSGNSSPNFLIIDVANPATPTLVSSLTLPGSPTNVAVNGNNAYVTNASSTNQLQVIDISKPSAPAVSSTFNCPGSAGGLGLSTSTNFVYMTRSANGGNAEFCIVNVSSSKKPVLAGSYGNNVNMNAVYVSGNDAYLATASDTQEIIDINIQKPTLPTFTAAVDLPGTTDALSANGFGSTLFVGQGPTLYSFTVNSGTLTTAGSIPTTGAGTINDIAIDPTNSFVFLATTAASAEFQVVNASDITNMSIIHTVDVSGALNGLNYVASIDAVAAASASDSQELMIFAKN